MDGTSSAKPSANRDLDASLVGEYSVRDVAELLSIPKKTVRRCARDGLVEARREEGGEYRFTLDAVIALRELNHLLGETTARRVRRALHRVRAGKGVSSPQARIRVEDGHLVARDEHGVFNPLSGQSLIDMWGLRAGGGGEGGDIAFEGGTAEVVAFPEPSPLRIHDETLTSDDWFRLAYECETEGSLDDAAEAYRRAIDLDATHLDAALNLGRLLHEGGQHEEAELRYRQVLDERPDDSLAAFNLGVLLEDQQRLEEALCAYELAIEHDPEHADAHYNAARLYQATGQTHRALWHFQVYRNLVK